MDAADTDTPRGRARPLAGDPRPAQGIRAGKPVLRDIVARRSRAAAITAIIGPSGTGKSTLIRCINRLVEPTAGEILFRGQDLARLRGTALRAARRRIGMVFQEYNLVERLSVMENVLCGRLGYVAALARLAAQISRRRHRARLRAARRGRPAAISPRSAPTSCPAASASASASRAR